MPPADVLQTVRSLMSRPPFSETQLRSDTLTFTGPDLGRYQLKLSPVAAETLEVDADGLLWHYVMDADGASECFGAGHVTRPRPFPACLTDQFERLLAEWLDREAFGRGCDAAAAGAYLDAVGEPGRNR